MNETLIGVMIGLRRVWIALALGGWLLSGAGCRSDEANTNQAQATASTDSGAPSASVRSDGPCPTRGEYRCSPTDPRQLQYCDTDTVRGWTDAPNGKCDSAELCDPTRKRCLKCKPNDYECIASDLKKCTSTGSGLEYQDTCPGGQDYCSSTLQECVECLPSEVFCYSRDLYTCDNGGLILTPCPSDAPCNIASKACRACVEGEYQCNEHTQLSRCDAQHQWQPIENCLTEKLCTNAAGRLMGDTKSDAVCDTPACNAEEIRCNPDQPARLEKCSPQRDVWELVDTCASGPLCNAAAGRCEEPACGSPGTYRCNGMALQVCSADGVQWTTMQTCNTADECNVNKHDCERCQPDEWQCNWTKLQQCDAMQHWQDKETCVSPGLCQLNPESQTQACKAPACPTPGEYSCTGAQLVQCSMDQASLSMGPICDSPALCNPADQRCNVAACPVANEATCVGQELRICLADQSAVQNQAACPAGQICDSDGRGCLSECPNPPYRCNGPLPEHCVHTADRFEWEVIGPACASHSLCHATAAGGVCDNAVCGGPTLTDYRCAADGKIERCNDQRTGWQQVGACVDGTICDPGPQAPTTVPGQTGGDGPPQCDKCVAGKYSCSNGTLQRCSDDGQMNVPAQQCRGALYCSAAADGNSGFCLECDPGEKRCNAGDLQRCGDDRRWVADQTCDPVSGCHDGPGNADYCNACPMPGVASCDTQSSIRTCSPDQTAWIGEQNCLFGCEKNALGLGQAGCRACGPGSTECGTDETLRTCNALGSWDAFAACASGSTCRDSGASDYCTSCTPGARTCAGPNSFRECPASGVQTATAQACPTDKPACSNGVCVECLASDQPKCPGGGADSSFRQVCQNGKWVDASCGNATTVCFATTGQCVACVPGVTQCTGDTRDGRRSCDANGNWLIQNCTATGADVCLGGSCAACKPGDPARCSSATVKQTCDSAGRWQNTTCADPTAVCVSGACQACNPSTSPQRCVAGSDPAARQTCSSAGAWVNAACSGDTPVCGANGACTCSPGTRRCNGSVRQVCQAAGSAAPSWVADACASGQFCTGTGAATTCSACRDNNDCPSSLLPICSGGSCVCENGNEQCTSGGAHQVCTAGIWQGMACTGDTSVCDAMSGTCVCQNGNKRCSGGVRQTCVNKAWQADAGSPACTACMTDAQCSGNTPLCDGVACAACTLNGCPNDLACDMSSGACVECTTADLSLCTTAKPACSSAEKCVQCTSSSKQVCTGNTPACVNNQCAKCASDTDCTGNASGTACDTVSGACVKCTSANNKCPSISPALPACSGNQCVQCTASDQARCTSQGLVCDDASHTCVQCIGNTQCSGMTPRCDVATHLCGGCVDDTACTSMTVCDTGAGGVCVPCTPNNDSKCLPNTACTASNQCVECTTADQMQCTQNGKVCDAATNKCVQCISDMNCGANQACNSSHQCVGCMNDINCSAFFGNAKPACNTSTFTCVECTSTNKAHCTDSAPACTSNACAACTSNADCSMSTSGNKACNTGTGACVACNGNGDCMGSNPVCSNHQCVGCAADSDCSGTKPICGGSNTCAACTTDAQCGSKKICASDGSCSSVQCKVPGDCSSGQVCSAQHTCVQCAVNMNCPSGVCSANVCVECGVSGDCTNPAKPVCSGSVCVQCTSSTQCTSTPATAVCDTTSKTCVQCTASSAMACSGTTPVCNSTSDVCTGCSSDGQCAANSSAPRCGSAGACVECTADSQCLAKDNTKPVCSSNNTCVVCEGNKPGACSMMSQVCGPARSCVQCTTDAQCAPQIEMCDPMSNICVSM